ncbi:hypothetical protein [Alkaliphilus serpentinus]|uniref:Flavoprotein n=1 Tax=Alkaliphilus serpentinus TaxID=1482731 RepID=A0A833HPC5_9FIRM|nr:hypothetical protein [Alkaliphilus serpentinus]KAB3530537.1 hypothetical protein F8153_06715 [Alkaliphilus serpentinus]
MSRYNQTQRIIEHLILRSNSSISNQGGTKHLMVALTGTNISRDQVFNDLSSLSKEGFTYDIVLSDSGEEINDISEIRRYLNPKELYTEKLPLAREGYLEGIDGFLVPLITQNTAIKLSLGIQDQLVPRMLWQALWQDKPVWMNFKDLLQYKGLATNNPHLIEKLKGTIAELKKMGVRAYEFPFNMGEVKKVLNFNKNNTGDMKGSNNPKVEFKGNEERRVITESDILTSKPSNGEIMIPAGAIITPLAKDTAKALGLKIVRK